LVLIWLCAGVDQVFAQGCVVARGAGMPALQFGSFTPNEHAGNVLDHLEAPPSKFEVALGYRYLHSSRHFIGTEEQKERHAEGSQVINNSSFLDLSLIYRFNDRYLVSLSFRTWITTDRKSFATAVRNETYSSDSIHKRPAWAM